MNGQGGNCKGSGKVRAGERGINPERLEAPKVNICHLIILLRVPHYFAKRTSFYQHLPLEEKRYFSSFSRSLVARERGREGRREGKRERRGEGRRTLVFHLSGPSQQGNLSAIESTALYRVGQGAPTTSLTLLHMSTLLQWLSANAWLRLTQRPIISFDASSMAKSAVVNTGLQRTEPAKLPKALLFPRVFLSKGHVLSYIFVNVTPLNSLKRDLYLKCQICIDFQTQKLLI